MTLKDLEQIIYIKSEINVLSRRLIKATGDDYVADTVKDYSTGYERTLIISGYALKDYDKIDRIHSLLEKRKKELEEKVLEAELYIASISDSKIRTLLTLRFLEGNEWEHVARKFYKRMSADSARKAVIRYFEKLSVLSGNSVSDVL